MTVVGENFYRKTELVSFEYQLDLPCKILAENDERLWASIQIGQVVVPLGVTTNPYAQIGDPDVAVFLPAQGACYFETYGTNELYLLNLPIGTDIAISRTFKKPKAVQELGRDVQRATSIVTVCGASSIPVVGFGQFADFLPADPTRRRVTVKGDSVFAALSDGTDPAQFMTIAPFFPGYAVVEGTGALTFTNFGTGPTTAWWIMDIEVSS